MRSEGLGRSEGQGRRRPLGRPATGSPSVLPPEPDVVAPPTATEVAERRRPVEDAVPYSIQVAAGWSWRLLLVLLAVAALVLGLSVAKVLWVPVVIALLLTVLLGPVVRLLERRARFPRALAAITTTLALVAAIVGLLTVAGREMVQGFADLWSQAEQGLESLTDALASGPLGIDGAQVEGYVEQAREQLSANSGTLVTGVLSATTTVGHVVAGAIITVFCLFFFLKDGPQIWAWLLRLLPRAARLPAYEASRRGAVTLASFTRTQILVALIDAVGIGVGAALLGVPLALPLGVLVFLGSFIPIVGAVATGSIAILVALVDQGPASALWMLVIVLGVQQVESHLLQPLLLGHAVSLHPVAVLLAVAAGSLAAGIVGALLAVPLTATVNTVVLYLHGKDKFPALGSDEEAFRRRLRGLDGHPADEDDAGPVAPDEAKRMPGRPGGR